MRHDGASNEHAEAYAGTGDDYDGVGFCVVAAEIGDEEG